MNNDATTIEETAIALHDAPGSGAALVPAHISPTEIPVLARQLGEAHRKSVAAHAFNHGTTLNEADALLSKPVTAQYQKHLMDKPADSVSWNEINVLAHTDPELALQRMMTIRQTAMAELRSGHRSAAALAPPGQNSPWNQAKFVAALDELAADWKPTTGVERILLQQAALAHCEFLHWLGILSERSALEFDEQPDRSSRERGRRWKAPRMTEAQAIDQAAEMMDRFERIFLRCVRTLTELRKKSIIVQQATNVNIADQQVNISGGMQDAANPVAQAAANAMLEE